MCDNKIDIVRQILTLRSVTERLPGWISGEISEPIPVGPFAGNPGGISEVTSGRTVEAIRIGDPRGVFGRISAEIPLLIPGEISEAPGGHRGEIYRDIWKNFETIYKSNFTENSRW